MTEPSPLPPDPPLVQFIHFPGIGCIRLSHITGWWWADDAGVCGLDIGLNDKRSLHIAHPERAREAEQLLLIAFGLAS